MPTQPWYVQDRAESLARVFLTAPRMVTLVEQRRHSDSDMDLVLAITPPSGAAAYRLAVAVKGYDGAHTPVKDLRVSRSILARARRSDLPTLLLMVDARNDRFHYAWLKLNGETPSPDQIHFRPLQSQADLERILSGSAAHAVPA